MRIARYVFLAAVLIGLAGCSSKFKSYNGPEVTQLLLMKGSRQLHLLNGNQILRSYDVGLGFAPQGHKAFSGDGRTPEGRYTIDKRNPNSLYHLSIGISYPNANDRARAAAVGKSPGGDIFIHGRGKHYKQGLPADWTAGCIAVTDSEMESIYAMVRDGTPISIYR